MEKYLSKNNVEVFIHPESHPHRVDLLEEVISKVELPLDQTFYRKTVDLSHIVGKDHLVEVDETDSCFYMPRGNRSGKSHMTFKEADDTTYATVVFCVATDPAEYAGKWVIVTLFEGKPGMREPFDKRFENGANPEEYAECLSFWKTHALSCTDEERKQAFDLARVNPEFFRELWSNAVFETLDEALRDADVDPCEEFNVRSAVWDGELGNEPESWDELIEGLDALTGKDERIW